MLAMCTVAFSPDNTFIPQHIHKLHALVQRLTCHLLALCCSAAVPQVAEFQQRKQQEVQALSSQLEQLQSSISSTQQLMSSALASQADAAGQALAAAQASQAASAGEMGQALQAAGQAVKSALESLRGSLEAQSSQLLEFSRQQQEATAAASQAAAAGLTRAKGDVASIGTSVQQLSGVAQNTTEAVNSKLAAFAADFESSMAEKQQALVDQLGCLLAGFVHDRQQAVAAAMAEVKQQLLEGQQELSGAAAGASAAVDGCISNLKVSTCRMQGRAVDPVRAPVVGMWQALTANCNKPVAPREQGTTGTSARCCANGLCSCAVCGPTAQAVGAASQQSTIELQQTLAAGVEQATAGVADDISRVQQLAAEHSKHASSMAGKLDSQTKVSRCCLSRTHPYLWPRLVNNAWLPRLLFNALADQTCMRLLCRPSQPLPASMLQALSPAARKRVSSWLALCSSCRAASRALRLPLATATRQTLPSPTSWPVLLGRLARRQQVRSGARASWRVLPACLHGCCQACLSHHSRWVTCAQQHCCNKPCSGALSRPASSLLPSPPCRCCWAPRV